MPSTTGPLCYTGHKLLRRRLVLSILSGKTVKITGIRPNDKNPGLRDYEVSFLRLLEKVTNGSVFEISYTGTSLLLKPGLITGGSITHDCPLSRSVGFYLEPLILLAPFCKKPLRLVLKGVTTDDKDLSVDLIRTVALPHLQLFGIDDGLELRIKKRGAPPLGGGEVEFLCPILKTQLKTLTFVDKGRVKRIRGIAHAVRVSPQFTNRMMDSCRTVLNRYIPDIYLYSDIYKGDEAGKSPGFALTLISTSSTRVIHSSETVSLPGEGSSPEDVALQASRLLLQEIRKGGCVDRGCEWMVLSLMCLGSEDVGKLRVAELGEECIQTLRDLRDFFGVKFKITPAPADPGQEKEKNEEKILSCFGIGYININRGLA